MSGKGTGKFGSKHSHYEYKKRCHVSGCNKRAKYIIEGKYCCREHSYKKIK